MRKRVLWSVALVLAAGAMPDCVCRRDATIRPALVIRVVDASGQPVAGAHVMVVHQTMPYSVLRDWWPVETTADGTVAVPELTRDETIAPLCMHGVPGHGFFVCAGKLGAGVEIVRVRGERQLELRLHDDYQDDCWNRNAYRAGGNLGWTLTADELERGRERVERLPAEGHGPDPAPPLARWPGAIHVEQHRGKLDASDVERAAVYPPSAGRTPGYARHAACTACRHAPRHRHPTTAR